MPFFLIVKKQNNNGTIVGLLQFECRSYLSHVAPHVHRKTYYQEFNPLLEHTDLLISSKFITEHALLCLKGVYVH